MTLEVAPQLALLCLPVVLVSAAQDLQAVGAKARRAVGSSPDLVPAATQESREASYVPARPRCQESLPAQVVCKGWPPEETTVPVRHPHGLKQM